MGISRRRFGFGLDWVARFAATLACSLYATLLFTISASAADSTAGQSAKFFLPRQASANSELRSSTSSRTAAAVKFPNTMSLPLPDSGKVSLLERIPGATALLQIPIYNSANLSHRSETIEVSLVTDYNDLFGVVTMSSEGTFATLMNRSAGEGYFYEVAPVGKVDTASASIEHEIVKVTEGELKQSLRCAAESALSNSGSESIETNSESARPATAALSTDAWRGIELFVVAPNEFRAGRSETQVVSQVANTVAAANLFFESINLVVDLVGVQIMSDTEIDPYSKAIGTGSAYEVLDETVRQWRGVSEPHHDAVVVFGRGEFSGIYGLAYTGSSCILPDYSVLFTTQGGITTAAQLSLASTLAHELGHFVGMDHDATRYSSGPSLMWPYYASTTTGFSAYSISKFEAHAGIGKTGGACLDDHAAPDPRLPQGPLELINGSSETVKVREGESSRMGLVLRGGNAGIEYFATRLPKGAKFDSTTGIVDFRPDFSVVSRKERVKRFRMQVGARSAGNEVRKTLIFEVQDVNRAPKLRFSRRAILAKVGEQVKFTVRASDPDEGDRVKVGIVSKRTFRDLPGQKSYESRNGVLTVLWTVGSSATGQYQLDFEAVDDRRLRTRSSLLVTILP